jgi:hypothetical protein
LGAIAVTSALAHNGGEELVFVSRRLITFYYLLTPLFWLADAAFGASLRVAALDGFPFWKVMYYLFCFACGVAMWKHPSWTGVIGLGEASLNILTLVLGFVVPYFRMVDQLAAGEAGIETSFLSPARATGLLVSGLVWVASFHLHLAMVRSRRAAV